MAIMRRRIHLLVLIGIAVALAVPRTARAVEVKVFSDSPLGPALTRIADGFQRQSRHTVKFVFGLSPVIHKRVMDGDTADVVIIQPNFIDELVKTGKLAPGEHPQRRLTPTSCWIRITEPMIALVTALLVRSLRRGLSATTRLCR
jgi:molybdate transport system substrate-binding protein